MCSNVTVKTFINSELYCLHSAVCLQRHIVSVTLFNICTFPVIFKYIYMNSVYGLILHWLLKLFDCNIL